MPPAKSDSIFARSTLACAVRRLVYLRRIDSVVILVRSLVSFPRRAGAIHRGAYGTILSKVPATLNFAGWVR